MKLKPAGKSNVIVAIIVSSMLIACSSSSETQDTADTENPEGEAVPWLWLIA